MRSTMSELTQEEQIRFRAYEIWQNRLRAGEETAGDALSDWLAAEAEIKNEKA